MLKKEAWAIVGGLSSPGKMPCPSYGLPAWLCNVGKKLAKVYGSTCANCYALKGQYSFSNVKDAQKRRLASLDSVRWVAAMVTLIRDLPYFRWHDSGDIQNEKHLFKIFEVCRYTPSTRHWLPTREYELVRQYTQRQEIPDNLIIRVSAPMVDGAAPEWIETVGLVSSTVHNKKRHRGRSCPAYKQDGYCGDCRACWNPKVQNVSYPEH